MFIGTIEKHTIVNQKSLWNKNNFFCLTWPVGLFRVYYGAKSNYKFMWTFIKDPKESFVQWFFMYYLFPREVNIQ